MKLLIQAAADTTVMQKARQEIDAAEQPETLILNPPVTNLFARVTGQRGKTIDGGFVPPGTEITSNAFVVQRDPDIYAPDSDGFGLERWLEMAEKANEMDSASFVFGMGPRVCLSKDIAVMELYKLNPEIVRRFDIELIKEGRYIVAGVLPTTEIL